MEPMKQGIFYCVGVGPGDPELMTVKAVRALEACPVIAAPRTKGGEMLALDIAKQGADLEDKLILPLDFSMTREEDRRRAEYEAGARAIAECLKAGQDVAMVNLGDVSIYATCTRMAELIKGKGFSVLMIPGVPSFCAVAARLGESLTAEGEPLHVFPAGVSDLDEALALEGTKVLMKSGRQLPGVIEALERAGALERASLVENCGLPGERVAAPLEKGTQSGYFSTIVVKE